MSIAPYAIGGSAIVIGLAVGYVKYMEHGTAAREAKADLRSAVAECSTNTADEVTQSALQQIATLTADVERQKGIAADFKKKSNDRLAENNRLRKAIQNVVENPQVPEALELLIDAQRVRGPDPGPGDGGADENPNGEAANPSGPVLSPETNPAPETPIG